MNRENGPEGDAEDDLLVGQGPSPARERRGWLRYPPQPPVPVTTLAEWVVPTGGGYFFSPSLDAPAAFAAG